MASKELLEHLTSYIDVLECQQKEEPFIGKQVEKAKNTVKDLFIKSLKHACYYISIRDTSNAGEVCTHSDEV